MNSLAWLAVAMETDHTECEVSTLLDLLAVAMDKKPSFPSSLNYWASVN